MEACDNVLARCNCNAMIFACCVTDAISSTRPSLRPIPQTGSSVKGSKCWYGLRLKKKQDGRRTWCYEMANRMVAYGSDLVHDVDGPNFVASICQGGNESDH